MEEKKKEKKASVAPRDKIITVNESNIKKEGKKENITDQDSDISKSNENNTKDNKLLSVDYEISKKDFKKMIGSKDSDEKKTKIGSNCDSAVYDNEIDTSKKDVSDKTEIIFKKKQSTNKIKKNKKRSDQNIGTSVSEGESDEPINSQSIKNNEKKKLKKEIITNDDEKKDIQIQIGIERKKNSKKRTEKGSRNFKGKTIEATEGDKEEEGPMKKPSSAAFSESGRVAKIYSDADDDDGLEKWEIDLLNKKRQKESEYRNRNETDKARFKENKSLNTETSAFNQDDHESDRKNKTKEKIKKGKSKEKSRSNHMVDGEYLMGTIGSKEKSKSDMTVNRQPKQEVSRRKANMDNGFKENALKQTDGNFNRKKHFSDDDDLDNAEHPKTPKIKNIEKATESLLEERKREEDLKTLSDTSECNLNYRAVVATKGILCFLEFFN